MATETQTTTPTAPSQDETLEPCHHCGLTMDPEDCGAAEIAAVYVDPDGETDGVEHMICAECLDAGSPDGPGYRAA